MCGIFGIINDQSGQAAQTVLAGLKKLEYRGYDSWGIALKPNRGQGIKLEKHIGKIGQAQTKLRSGQLAIGHTRWATHGGVTDKNAHPHLDCSGKLAVIHNGIVENYQQLRQKLNQRGHRFVSETDTEVIAHLIEELAKQKPLKTAVFEAFGRLVGSNAIAVLDSQTQQIIACRNGSPLVVGLAKPEFYLASDVTPFLAKTKQVVFINDQEGIVLSSAGVKVYDLLTHKAKKLVSQTLDYDLEDAEKAGFPHFLLKEIHEQLKTIPQTAQLNQAEMKQLAKRIKTTKRLVLIGCGSAYYCALATKYFLAQVGIEAEAYGAYEYLPFKDLDGRGTVMICISQSGETADTLIAAKTAQKRGAYVVAVVNAIGSSLERLSDLNLKIGAGPEIAVVSTKAFTAQLASLYLLSQAVAGQFKLGQKQIAKAGQQLKAWLKPNLLKQIMALAKQLLDQQAVYVIGKHLNYPAALEFSLKLKETSYTHAEAFAAGELKHGVISLIQPGTPCVALLSNDEVQAEVLSSAIEVKARGGQIIGVGPVKSSEFDYLIKTPDLGDLTMLANIMVGQLLGYYLGVGRGADPDKPRNLAKSVTVK